MLCLSCNFQGTTISEMRSHNSFKNFSFQTWLLIVSLSPWHYLSGCKKALLLPRSAFPFPLFYYNPLLIDNQLFSETFFAHSIYNWLLYIFYILAWLFIRFDQGYNSIKKVLIFKRYKNLPGLLPTQNNSNDRLHMDISFSSWLKQFDIPLSLC